MLTRGWEDRWAFWRWNFLAWSAFAVVAFGIRCLLFQSVGSALLFTVVLEPIAFLISGILFWAYQRTQPEDNFGVVTAAMLVGVSFLAAIVTAAIARGWSDVLDSTPPGWSSREEWLLRLVFSWFAFLSWSLAFYALRSRRLAVGALQQAERVELDLLRAQLDPHFLFNSLNSVAAEIPERPEAAEEMIHELADYLRFSLDQRHHLVSPLATEIDAMVAYLRIEQVRYGERMEATVEAETLARRRLVPSFLLQPLVENAVKHGLKAERCVIGVVATSEGATLRILVTNPGRIPESLEVVEGVGLETLRRRLALHYPGRSTFELSHCNGVVGAELALEGEPCFA
ncbi:MAG: histidine kinase [Chthoniobacterales bacterium]